MTAAVQPWLPVDVLAREAAHAAVGRAVADWSTQWFPRPQVIVSGFQPTREPPRGEGDAGWAIHGARVATSFPRAAVARLAGWALDAPLDRLALRKPDRRLLGRFETALVADLAHKVELAIGLDSPPPGPARPAGNPFGRLGGAVVSLADECGAVLGRLAVPFEAALPLCRASLPPAAGERTAMGRVAQALGGAEMTIEASLGIAEVPLAALRTLAPGDVLVLQRGLADAIDVSLAGSTAAFARAKMIDLDGEVVLALQT